MKLLVPVKRVIDYNVRVRLTAAGDAVETAGVKMSLNPFDETAVEAAMQLKEAGLAGDIVVVSVGPAETAETLRTALAMGADRAILILCDAAPEPLSVARLLKAVCDRETPDLVVAGRQAIDDDAAQVGPMLAGMLGWAQGVGVSGLKIDETEARVRCETGDGVRTLALRLPAVLTADLRWNTPRYVTLPGVMKAKRKRLETVPAADLGVALQTQTERVALREPPPRPAGVRCKDVAAFCEAALAGGVV